MTKQPESEHTKTVEVLNLFRERLSSVPRGPQDFSARGSAAIIASQNEYLTRIGLEAIRLAIDEKSDYVDETHVDRAGVTLFRKSTQADWLKWLGGLLLGIAIPLIVQFNTYAVGKPPPNSLVYWMLATASLGLATTFAAIALTITARRRLASR